MKKVLISILLLVLGIPLLLYILNPYGIYQLNDKTTRFVEMQAIPEGLNSLKAADCGVCHVEIYHEWQTSLHAKAFTDPFFQAYHRKDKGDPTCLICHTPLQNQSPVKLEAPSDRFKDLRVSANPEFDSALQQEGITCSACHVRDGIIYGPYPKENMNAPHPVDYDEKFLSHALCDRCHEVPSKNFSLMNEGICSTGMEFAGGHWAEQGYICQNCHMPEVVRPLMEGFPSRKGRRHLWPGAYSESQLKQVFSFSASSQESRLLITITNSGAGHRAPTGDPDRFIIIDFHWRTDQGQKVLLESVEFKRRIIWQPVMFVLSDNRLGPGESLTLSTDLPDSPGVLTVDATYNVMTGSQLNRLKDNYGLKNEWAVERPFLRDLRIAIDPPNLAG